MLAQWHRFDGTYLPEIRGPLAQQDIKPDKILTVTSSLQPLWLSVFLSDQRSSQNEVRVPQFFLWLELEQVSGPQKEKKLIQYLMGSVRKGTCFPLRFAAFSAQVSCSQFWTSVASEMPEQFFPQQQHFAMGSLAQIGSGALQCSFNTRFRARFRRVQKVPVQSPDEVPEDSIADTC